MRRLLFALAAVAAGAWMVLDAGTARDRGAYGREASVRAARDPDAPPRAPRIAQALPPRAPLPESVVDPFLATGRSAPQGAPSRAAAATPAPPLPFRFVGRVTQQGATQVYVARGAKLFQVRQGDVLDNEYRVEALAPGEIAFVHLRSGNRQVMTLSPPIEGAARPLEWLNSLTLNRSPVGGVKAP